MGYSRIAKRLNEEGVVTATGRAWSLPNVKRFAS
jgi:hypothetical protein